MRIRHLIVLVFAATAAAFAQQPATQPATQSAALTIYNDNFAVVRTLIDLDLHPGSNEVTTNQVTTQLEPDSVVLRDPANRDSSKKPIFHIVEQNYDSAVVTQDWLLRKYEGKTIDFEPGPRYTDDGKLVSSPLIQGKIVRALQPQPGYGVPLNQALVEVDGRLQFRLPGTPLFPATTDGLLLKPTLRWQIDADKALKLSAELAYISGGFNWEATYNLVMPSADNAAVKVAASGLPGDEKAEMVGWVTLHNSSGSDFLQARIKLMAGDVAKIRPRNGNSNRNFIAQAGAMSVQVDGQVTQKAFDDFHLYDLNRTVSLSDGETKQIQFIEASGVALSRSYHYDGADTDRRPIAEFGNYYIGEKNYGLKAENTKVSILEELKNTQANHLGIPLPAGRVRLYRRDADGQMEFVGESMINHTPTEETVKISTGNAFDLKGARRQTDFHINQNDRIIDESFEIKLTNQKPDPVNVDVLEHLYRCDNWEIQHKSADYNKLDSHTVEFPVLVPAKGETTLTYSVRYTW